MEEISTTRNITPFKEIEQRIGYNNLYDFTKDIQLKPMLTALEQIYQGDLNTEIEKIEKFYDEVASPSSYKTEFAGTKFGLALCLVDKLSAAGYPILWTHGYGQNKCNTHQISITWQQYLAKQFLPANAIGKNEIFIYFPKNMETEERNKLLLSTVQHHYLVVSTDIVSPYTRRYV